MNVHVRVTDEATGKPTPVRLRIGGADGTYYPPLGRPAEFPVGRNEDVGGHVYLNQKRYAYIDGGCEVPLPTGVPLDVEITKGPAYFPLRQTVTLGEGQLSLRFAVRRGPTRLGVHRSIHGVASCLRTPPIEAAGGSTT